MKSSLKIDHLGQVPLFAGLNKKGGGADRHADE
jgi:hypothetical protein